MIRAISGRPGSSQMQLGEKPVRVFRFLWISKTGPRLRHFTSVTAFSGYVAEVRKICGFDVVEFRTPILAVAVLP